MSAAIAAAEHGVPSTVVDEGADLGGQIYRRPCGAAGAPPPHPRGEALRARVAALGERIEVRRSEVAWGIFPGPTVAVTGEGRTDLLEPRALVLAPGAHEFVPPFPGWTLPGVMTPGAAQILVKTAGVAPGERVLVAGTGPFLLAVACQVLEAGARVVAVLEASRRFPWWTLPLHGWRTPRLLAEGLGYLRTLSRARAPVRYGRIVVAAEGDDRVRTVAHAPVDGEWRPDRNRLEREEADALLVGFGFVPRSQLAQMAGCRLAHRPSAGGWVPERDREMASSVPGVFAAGDGAGVAGALVAAAEGRIAGLAAAARLGALDAAALDREARPSREEIRRIAPMRRALDRISALRPGLEALADGDTLVCRCEEVTGGELRAAIRAGCTGYRSAKVATRVGMGACQGRLCWPSAARLVAAATGRTLEEIGPASARPPERPVTLGDLAGDPAGAP